MSLQLDSSVNSTQFADATSAPKAIHHGTWFTSSPLAGKTSQLPNNRNRKRKSSDSHMRLDPSASLRKRLAVSLAERISSARATNDSDSGSFVLEDSTDTKRWSGERRKTSRDWIEQTGSSERVDSPLPMDIDVVSTSGTASEAAVDAFLNTIDLSRSESSPTQSGDVPMFLHPDPSDAPSSHPEGATASMSVTSTVSVYDECRSRLVPLVVQNAKQRNPEAQIEAGMEQNLKSILTDEHCADFLKKSQEFKEQVLALGPPPVRVKEEPMESSVSEASSLGGTKGAWEVHNGVDGGERPRARRRFDPVVEKPVGPRDDSEITLIDPPPHIPLKPIPKAPRAMLPVKTPKIEPEDHDLPPPVLDHPQNGWINEQIGRDDYYDPNLPSPNLDGRNPRSRYRNRRASYRDDSPPPYSSPASSTKSRDYAAYRSFRPRTDYYQSRRYSSPSRSEAYSSHSHHADRIPLHTPTHTPTTDSYPLPYPPSEPAHRPCRVPGLWGVKVGLSLPQIVVLEFAVSFEIAAAARRWCCRDEYFDPNARHVVVKLVCLSKELVESAMQQLGDDASPASIAHEMLQIPIEWPERGSLVIDLNLGGQGEEIWLPDRLDPTDPPLDITPFIQAGINEMRIIQLDDMSRRVFILVASEPSPEELQAAQVRDDQRRLWEVYSKSLKSRAPLAPLEENGQISDLPTSTPGVLRWDRAEGSFVE
ncbi:hypothetical protein JAAARDRAFT_197654 [Jaapia argillacea MUCL 33604]|uniref:Uncharacterized protein n=1 Tax=Jaapia argillacea MUCL 33604 TaxID=933084 RepID=A0A067PE27_9AGAM|nr:hypothetical protein JAAARDRAFT_197654 [Jaapia argillacea MUCL 33604]